jgi:hypothetical protein
MTKIRMRGEDGKMTAKYLACLLFFGLAGCSGEAVITTGIDAQSRQAANISTAPTVKPAAEQIKALGDFTNVKSNGEHQWGYSVEIWKQGNKILGLISGDSASRLIGDPPTGLLENISFDAKTGKLSFRAVLPSDVYEFDGVLTKEKLKGKLSNTGINKIEIITLRRAKQESSEMEEFESCEDWKKYADRILDFRGPKRRSGGRF